MAIFKKQFHYDNSLVYVDTEYTTHGDSGLNVRFAHGPFNMDYYGLQSSFIKHFKEEFTAFYEKVMKDYDEVIGRSNTFEECFDAMVEDMTTIDYRPIPRYIQIDFDPIGKYTDRQLIYDTLIRKYYWCDSEAVEDIMNDTIAMMEGK